MDEVLSWPIKQAAPASTSDESGSLAGCHLPSLETQLGTSSSKVLSLPTLDQLVRPGLGTLPLPPHNKHAASEGINQTHATASPRLFFCFKHLHRILAPSGLPQHQPYNGPQQQFVTPLPHTPAAGPCATSWAAHVLRCPEEPPAWPPWVQPCQPSCRRRVLTPNLVACRRSRRRVRLRRRPGTSQVVSVFCSRQVAGFILHPSTIRTCQSSPRNLPSPRALPRRPPEHRKNRSQLTCLWAVVELGRRSTTSMDGAEHGDARRLLLHPG